MYLTKLSTGNVMLIGLSNKTLGTINVNALHTTAVSRKHSRNKLYSKKTKRSKYTLTSMKKSTWRLVKYSGTFKVSNKKFYDKNKLYDLRVIRILKLKYATTVLFLTGKNNSEEKQVKLGIIRRLRKKNLLKLKKIILRRWLTNYLLTSKKKAVKAFRRVLKSSGVYYKLHILKFRNQSHKMSYKKFVKSWVKNGLKKIYYFKAEKIKKVVYLQNRTITSQGVRRQKKQRNLEKPTRALAFMAWKNLYLPTELQVLGGRSSFLIAKRGKVNYEEVGARNTAFKLMGIKRKSFKRKTIFGLTELAAVLNPVKLKKIIGHPFHLVTPSMLPFALSIAFLCVFQNLLGFMWFPGWHHITIYVFHAFFFANLFLVILTWILEIFKEEQTGAHTIEIQKGFQYAILLFILSELMLFFSFFWAYFHYTLNSNSFTGGTYTPKGLVVFYWYRIPLLNTVLLLASGLSLTIAHTLLVESDKVFKLKVWIKVLGNLYFYRVWGMLKKRSSLLRSLTELFKKQILAGSRNKALIAYDMQSQSIRYSNDSFAILPKVYLLHSKKYNESVVFTPSFWILDTALKGFVFLMYQAYEYTSSMFAINDSVYGAVFFSLTGLHGLHVFVGVMSLFTYVIVTHARDMDQLSIRSTRVSFFRKRRVKTFAAKQASSYKLKYFSHRVAFDGAAWYWHFVDVVWFFVFIFVYWWGFASDNTTI